MAKSKNAFYVVWIGRTPGIYTSWEEAKLQIDGFQGARYKGFATEAEATEAFAQKPKPLPGFITHPTAKPDPVPADATSLKLAVAVDAACSGNPGVMEYRGVSLWDNQQVFHHKYEVGTNNIGEFLAIVECLARLKNAGREDITVYSDSMIAIGWVRRKECRTKLIQTPRTVELLDVVRRAELWLRNNSFANPIVKWPTEQWGEIPADFGRKG